MTASKSEELDTLSLLTQVESSILRNTGYTNLKTTERENDQFRSLVIELQGIKLQDDQVVLNFFDHPKRALTSTQIVLCLQLKT